MNPKVAAKVVVALVATFAFVWLVARSVDTGSLLDTVRDTDLRWLAAGATATLATTLLRAARLSLVLDGRLTPSLIAISVTHNATTALLPMKLGEFMLPLLLSRARRMDVSSGLGILVLLRLLDMLALGLLGATMALAAFSRIGEDTAARSSSLVAVGTLASIIMLWMGWGRLSDTARRGSSFARIKVLSRAAQAMTTMTRGRLMQSYVFSLAIWATLFTAFYCFSRAISVDVGPAAAATIGAAASLAFAFPISGIANVGPFQAAWVWMSRPFGVEAESALAASILAHGVVVIATTVLALMLLPLLLKAISASKTTR